jgi:hypothetical protein
VRVYRERCTLDDQAISTETAYYLTSLPTGQASPADLDRLVRGHWGETAAGFPDRGFVML